MKSTGRSPAFHARGFTLAEVIVALVLLACAALAAVSASAAGVRAIAEAERQERAVGAARDRVEQLASRDCSSLRAGATVDTADGIVERWTVSPIRNGARLVTDSVEYTDRGASRKVGAERLVLC
jgi:prepilin-type N-terminal cleavage/methylation domain-containing protein